MSISALIGSIFIVFILCIDSFVISVAYGSNKIKIPFITTVVIGLIGSSFLFLSIMFGSYMSEIVSIELLSKFVFVILFLMGFLKFVEGLFKYAVSKINRANKKIDFKISNVNFSLDIICDENTMKRGGILSFREGIALGIALSLDSLVVGMGIAMIDINYYFLTIVSLLVSILCMNLGYLLGKKISIDGNYEVGWLNGIMLMTMAISKIIKL